MRRVLIVMLLLVGLLVPGPDGEAQQAPGLLLILDASGSMNQDAGDGATLLDEAKAALREIVLRLPGDSLVGLRVYGHRAPNDDRAAGCVDTELIIPVGPVDRGEMFTAIGEFDARGWTPIGLSLQEAVDDLGPGGGTIILVSDGVDTCAPPDPCEVARQLAEDGYVSHIHTVGLLLQDQAAVHQLQCIAAAGNGSFTDIGSVDGLLESLAGIVDRAIEGGIDAPGVQGALQRDLAPVLPWMTDEGGFGSFALAQAAIASNEVRWYAVEVTDPSSQLAASFNVDWRSDITPDEFIEIRIFNEQGIEIGVPNEVAGVVVDAPQRLHLVETSDWYEGLPIGQAADVLPTAVAVTDPISMFPAWEADQDWFAPTVTRFHEAGLNGGVYEAFKRQPLPDPLPQGTYYVAVVWESGRQAITGMQLSVTMYPAVPEPDDSRADRPVTPVRVDDGSEDPFPLEPVRWAGDEIGGGLPEPTRAIEVWSALGGDEQRYSLEMAEGEVLAVGWDRWYGIGFPNNGWMDLRLLGPDGEVPEIDFDTEVTRLGFMSAGFFVAPTDGEFTLVVTPEGLNLDAEPALALAAFVLPPAAFDVLEGAGISGMEPDRGVPIDDEIHRQAMAAVMAGLQAVARSATVEG